MMKTENYNLNQWEPTDHIRREDFNADNTAIDAALGAIPQLHLGSYTGDGEESQDVELGAKPRLAFVWCLGSNSIFSTYHCSWGLATAEGGTKLQSIKALELTETGFRVFYGTTGNYSVNTNKANLVFCYLVLM